MCTSLICVTMRRVRRLSTDYLVKAARADAGQHKSDTPRVSVMCKQNTRQGVSRCTSICDVDLFVFNFFGVWPVLHTSIVYGGRQWSRTHAFQPAVINHAAVAGAMHASAIHACTGTTHIKNVRVICSRKPCSPCRRCHRTMHA